MVAQHEKCQLKVDDLLDHYFCHKLAYFLVLDPAKCKYLTVALNLSLALVGKGFDQGIECFLLDLFYDGLFNGLAEVIQHLEEDYAAW